MALLCCNLQNRCNIYIYYYERQLKMQKNTALERVLEEVKQADVAGTTIHSVYTSGLIEDEVAGSPALSRVLEEVKKADVNNTTIHSVYTSGLIEDAE